MPPTKNTDDVSRESTRSPYLFFTIAFFILAPVIVAILIYQLDSFDPAPIPTHELTHPPPVVLIKNDHILQESEHLGEGKLKAPEDIAYDSKLGLFYTSCEDGWIKRVTVNDSVADSVVENWVNTGGRPLGIVLGNNNEVVIADAYKGLLKISSDGGVELLTNEAEGLKFKLTDGVDIAEDGIIYFTDGSYKYYLHEVVLDILEGKPYGRVISFDPVTQKTKVLVSGLYFPNGIAISPDQQSIVFCETPMRRCRKFYIQGNKKGQIENFINLPGVPDNIHYDGQGHFWIAIGSGTTAFWDLAYRYPVIRKFMAILIRYTGPIFPAKNGGVFVVDLDGKPIAHYYDPGLRMTSAGVKIGAHLYCGSIIKPYILRFNLDKHTAHFTTEA